MKIVMDVPVSGGRADGSHWPPVGAVLEVEDWEGAELCAAGLAHPHVEERSAETPEQPLEARTEARAAPKAPRPRPPKQG